MRQLIINQSEGKEEVDSFFFLLSNLSGIARYMIRIDGDTTKAGGEEEEERKSPVAIR